MFLQEIKEIGVPDLENIVKCNLNKIYITIEKRLKIIWEKDFETNI